MSLDAVAEPFVAAIGWRPLRLRDGADQTPAFWKPVAAMAAASEACVDEADHGCYLIIRHAHLARHAAPVTACTQASLTHRAINTSLRRARG